MTPSTSTQIRFIATDNAPAGTVEGGIDGVLVSSFRCVPLGNGDFDGDTDVDLADVAQFMTCFGTPVVLEPACMPGNVAGADGAVDAADFETLTALMSGP